LLAVTVFGFTARTNSTGPGLLTPLIIGCTLTTLICVFAPLTMAGFNPARDLAPRIFSSLAGWGSLPFTVNGPGWLIVYVLAPVAGAIPGAALADALHRPAPVEDGIAVPSTLSRS
jgi:glycerol uptake facilitator protein